MKAKLNLIKQSSKHNLLLIIFHLFPSVDDDCNKILTGKTKSKFDKIPIN